MNGIDYLKSSFGGADYAKTGAHRFGSAAKTGAHLV